MTPLFSESARQFVHIAMGGFALLLRVLTWPQAAALAAAALAFNLFVLFSPQLSKPSLFFGIYSPPQQMLR